MYIADKWTDYELIDAGSGERLERWGKYKLIRPDPQVIWSSDKKSREWQNASASYIRSESGGGNWKGLSNLPEKWQIGYQRLDLTFNIKPMGFKHTGLFPEQAVNWEWFYDLIKNAGRPVKVLNLFAYTGGATLAAAAAGASVTHVDAAKGIVSQARENANSSGLSEKPIRWIVNDCRKFTEREIRRENYYDAVIMDPPSYGRGPTGEVWKLEENIDDLVKLTVDVLSDDPLFFLINLYTTGLSPSTLEYILGIRIKERYGGHTECDEVGIPVQKSGLVLPCGSAARWTNK